MSRKDVLDRACGTEVSRETLERLEAFEALFRQWSKSINLAAPSTLETFWTRHVVDSAQLWRYRSTARNWVDLGSGGGLPGIVLACLFAGSDREVSLVESNQKKAGFLRTCVVELGLPARVIPKRIEMSGPLHADIVTARALAPLDKLLEWSASLTAGAHPRLLLQKGREFQSEIDQAHGNWIFDLLTHSSVIDDESRILELSNVRRRDD